MLFKPHPPSTPDDKRLHPRADFTDLQRTPGGMKVLLKQVFGMSKSLQASYKKERGRISAGGPRDIGSFS